MTHLTHPDLRTIGAHLRAARRELAARRRWDASVHLDCAAALLCRVYRELPQRCAWRLTADTTRMLDAVEALPPQRAA